MGSRTRPTRVAWFMSPGEPGTRTTIDVTYRPDGNSYRAVLTTPAGPGEEAYGRTLDELAGTVWAWIEAEGSEPTAWETRTFR